MTRVEEVQSLDTSQTTTIANPVPLPRRMTRTEMVAAIMQSDAGRRRTEEEENEKEREKEKK